MTPSATHGVTHGAVDEVKRDEDGMGGGENKHLWTVSSDHEHSPTQGLAWGRAPLAPQTARYVGRRPVGARVTVFACVTF